MTMREELEDIKCSRISKFNVSILSFSPVFFLFQVIIKDRGGKTQNVELC